MALQSCSVAARGLWVDMLCIAHECEPYGHLTVNGKAMTAAQIGRHTGLTQREAEKLLQELADAGVSSATEEGVIFSRRMVRDEEVRNRRAEGGKAGSEHGIKGAEHGSKGGRPPKPRGVSEPPLEPPPSSSSSSSTSVDTPSSPQGGQPLLGLKAWIEAVRLRGEKPIPAGHPVYAYADRVGIPREFLALAWRVFRTTYTGGRSRKRYRDWRQVFQNAVEGNWLKLWYIDSAGAYGLTTVGIQAQRANDERSAA